LELKTLFSPEKIGSIQIKNRIVRSATYLRSTEKYGYVGEKLINIYSELARGGTGLIISGYIAVSPDGTASPYQMCLYDDSFMEGQKKLVDAAHEYADVKIAAQIAHTGHQGDHPKYPTVAPSPIPSKYTGLTPQELTTEEVYKFIKIFIDVGQRVYECGYDMIQLHAAHGYFLSNFISPYTNKRNDEFGGTTQKRAKILIDIYNGLRDELGKRFPIIIKLQTQDFIPNGLTFDEGVELAKILSETGFDAIEPSGGGTETQALTRYTFPSQRIKSPQEENYFLPVVKAIKPHMKKSALILMGGIKNPLFAEQILKDKIADFIALCRPLIFEPDLPNRWKSGDLSPAKCISCNACFMSIAIGPVYCVHKKRLEEKKKKKSN
jgi:2,4-dienoyl-CoA reductase-like NADH-dependent reductase (Old Yellow Enzyme family)